MSHVVLYDDGCNFCKVTVDAVMDWDRGRGRIRARAIQQPECTELLGAMPEDRKLASFHLIRPDGSVISAGPALEELLRLLPGGGPLASLLGRFPDQTAAGYWWIARNRMTLSRPVPKALKRRATRRLAERRARGA